MAVLLAIFIFAGGCAGTTPRPVTIKACTFRVAIMAGNLTVLYERAVIVGEVQGADEWWLNLVDREPTLDIEGRARAVNWPKSRVLRQGEVRLVDLTRCVCPETFWGN